MSWTKTAGQITYQLPGPVTGIAPGDREVAESHQIYELRPSPESFTSFRMIVEPTELMMFSGGCGRHQP